jgi:hypothetical protein
MSLPTENLPLRDFPRWMQMEKWDACGFPVDEKELLGRECYGGLDLSSSIDITAFVLVFPPRDDVEKYVILPYFWIPEENMRLRVRRDHVPYDVWEKQGCLMTTGGNVIHYGFAENFIEELGKKFHIREIAFDRWGAVQMVQNLEGLGFTVVSFGQGFKDMSPPSKRLMELVLEKKIAHGGHPVLRWMMDNIFVRTDPAGNIKPDKEKSTEKIDGAVATVMALDRAIRNEGNNGGSVYDDRGILVLLVMSGNKRDNLWKFAREELKSLFALEAKLIKQCSLNINERPLKGILVTQLSNFILKSRDGYNDGFIYKYIPVDTAVSSSKNHQIWMRKTEKLNDEREQRVIPELFQEDSWINYQWAKKIDFSATRTYYVSAFSKNKNDADMSSEYGSCIFGFKNDRLVELLSPISMRKFVRNKDVDQGIPKERIMPVCCQVIAFDVMYDTDKAKEDLNFLMEIIDILCDDEQGKHDFLEHIMQYWILSVKDSKWSGEKERRYVLFLYDEYDYIELEFDDTFLKENIYIFTARFYFRG